MEQIYKRTIPSRKADKPSTVQQNCLANSNAIYYSTAGSFARLSADVKCLLKYKKSVHRLVDARNLKQILRRL